MAARRPFVWVDPRLEDTGDRPEDASTAGPKIVPMPGLELPPPDVPGPDTASPGTAPDTASPGTAHDDLCCSAKDCRRSATWALLWRNPRIHGPERTKRWLACDRHRDPLSDFLARRDFPLRVEPLPADGAADGAEPDHP